MGVAGGSEAFDKAKWHRRYRQGERQRLLAAGIEYVERGHREYSDPWGMAKDGKVWCLTWRTWKRWLRK